jgi:hypothetical protein
MLRQDLPYRYQEAIPAILYLKRLLHTPVSKEGSTKCGGVDARYPRVQPLRH